MLIFKVCLGLIATSTKWCEKLKTQSWYIWHVTWSVLHFTGSAQDKNNFTSRWCFYDFLYRSVHHIPTLYLIPFWSFLQTFFGYHMYTRVTCNPVEISRIEVWHCVFSVKEVPFGIHFNLMYFGAEILRNPILSPIAEFPDKSVN